jgi:hypothetical protein
MLVDFCLCDQNTIFFRDLMLMKVSELNGLFGSLLDHFASSFARADVLASEFLIDSLTFFFRNIFLGSGLLEC